jgi:exopolyphosphatase / guanosine-5'-triphosphate,3'-diphosphate pyrophosphatase
VTKCPDSDTAVMWFRHHAAMLVGVVDVGANTVRLQVTRGNGSVLRAKATLRLGESIERFGRIPDEKLDETAVVVGRFAREAHKLGVERFEVLVTSPGRQAANGEELIGRLALAANAPARVLESSEEGRLAFIGATAGVRGLSRRLVAVVDVGGGSAQIAVGTRRDGPAWVRSFDIGSMRLTRRMSFSDPPGLAAIGATRDVVERVLDGVIPPFPQAAIAVGGSARALKSMLGGELGPGELASAVSLLAQLSAAEIIERYGIEPDRAATLPAGAVILAAIRSRLGVPLRVGRGGVREGALLELDSRRQAA